MSSENENEQGLDEERDDSSSRDDADTRSPHLSDFKNVDKSSEFDNDVDAAVRASAEHEAAKRKLEAARRRNSDDAEEDSSSLTERRVRQDVLPPSTPNYGPGVALPAYRDGPQLVGVTVSTAGADTPEAVGVTELGVILKRNFRTIVLIIFLIIALSALALAFVTPRYSASTDILFGSDVTANRGSNDVLSGVRDDEASMQSQVSLLTSSDLALRVIRKMGLKENPEFSADPDTSDQAIGGGVSVATMEPPHPSAMAVRVHCLVIFS